MPNASKPPFDEYFGMKNGRKSFLIEPDKDPQVLFGADYREHFGDIYNKMEERSYASLGYKAVLWGDFGLGKTHFLKHLLFSIENPSAANVDAINVYPIYIKLSGLTRKAPFSAFAADLIRSIGSDNLGNIAGSYLNASGTTQLRQLAATESIATAFEVMGRFPGLARQHAIQYLCGEKLSTEQLRNIETPTGRVIGQVTKGKEFGSILQIIATMVLNSTGKVLTYLVDEAERLRNITDADAYEQWLGCLREITDLNGLGLMLTIGAVDRDQLPGLLLENEIETRISPLGYIRLENLGESNIIDFLRDALQRMRDVSTAAAAANLSLQGTAADIWPFDQSGFDTFIDFCQTAPHANKPREILKALQEVTGRAYREKRPIIDSALVSSVLKIS
jgi:hypothetical protein